MAETTAVKLARQETEMKQLHSDVQEIKADLKEVKNTISSNFVTRAEFELIKKNRTLQVMMTILATSGITALITYFMVHAGK